MTVQPSFNLLMLVLEDATLRRRNTDLAREILPLQISRGVTSPASICWVESSMDCFGDVGAGILLTACTQMPAKQGSCKALTTEPHAL